MHIHLIEHDPDYLCRSNITRWAEKNGHGITIIPAFNTPRFPQPTDLDWLVVMGGSQHVWEEVAYPWLLPEKECISNALIKGKVILGICFGAQLLAEILGSQVYTNTHPEIGWHPVNVSKEGRQSFLLNNIPEQFNTFHWHSDHFLIPPHCTQLAHTEPTSNQVFVHNDISVVGIQFHPEFTCQMVNTYAQKYGHEWVPATYVTDKFTVLKQTEQVGSTYWLMEILLDNMAKQYTA